MEEDGSIWQNIFDFVQADNEWGKTVLEQQ